MSKDRPGGMDNMKFSQPKITQPTPRRANEMPAVVKAAGGRVDSANGIQIKAKITR